MFYLDFDIKSIPLYKRALSYIRPVWIKHERSVINLQLEILLYRGRFQLATGDALYSDGIYYTPALTVLKAIKKHLPNVKEMLILGAGLGSTIQIVRRKGYNPKFTLVEIDKVVLRLAMAFLNKTLEAKIDPVCADAIDFMEVNTRKYDLIFIDIFDSRTVPDFVTDITFLTKCKNSLNPGGKLGLNYIINDERKWDKTQLSFAAVFPKHQIIANDINRIFVAEL